MLQIDNVINNLEIIHLFMMYQLSLMVLLLMAPSYILTNYGHVIQIY